MSEMMKSLRGDYRSWTKELTTSSSGVSWKQSRQICCCCCGYGWKSRFKLRCTNVVCQR